MEMLSDSIARDGLLLTGVHVDALTSWTQFFKNLPVALIAFVLIFSDLFTREYKAGTLLLVLFSSLLQNNTGVALCVGGTVLAAYLWSIVPKVKAYSPAVLMNTNSLLMGVEGIDAYREAIVMAAFLCIVCVAVSIPVMNRRQL